MFNKILIANRGEIALRVIRACKELGIKTVAVYSEADADSLHVRFADEVVCIGPPPGHESYMNIPRLIAAAEVTNADAIHPGYGFLAENYNFAEICEANEIEFIGPSARTIAHMGNKSFAKNTMKKAGVPVIPGSEGTLDDLKHAKKLAHEIGFPVIIKASAGGGGRGMRIVRQKENLENAFLTARTEADASFGNADVYMEKYFENPRHIEVQILGDAHGNVISLGERECSIHRRHQKLIEESPSPVVTAQLRKRMNTAAVRGAKNANYQSAGTVEFLLDGDGQFYFMEMNTRIQVEHPVTESVIGMDLIKEQLRVAAGGKLDFNIERYKLRGHAIECRINAEDPEKNFRPSPGVITSFHAPGGPGIRVDTHAYAQYRIPPYYDSLVAKVITHGQDRDDAILIMERALEELVIEGIKTTIPLHLEILKTEKFRSGNYSTKFIEEFEEAKKGNDK